MSNFLSSTIFGEALGETDFLFDIEPISISSFFKKMDVRGIPDYQRPYSWTLKNTETLLDDIRRSSSEGKNWFLGTVYTTKTQRNRREGDILDGQQRLTTIQLILKEFTIFNILNDEIDLSLVTAETRQKFKDLITNATNCIYSQPSGEVVQRFKAEAITNETLKNYILETRDIDNRTDLLLKLETISSTLKELASESRTASTLERNIKLIRSYLENVYNSGENPEERILSLIGFVGTLLNRFWLIEVPLKNADLSLEIFEGINNRGKPLDLLDRLQFRSLTKLPDHTDVAKDQWKQLYIGVEDLVSTGVSKAFRDHTAFYKTLFLGISGEEQSDNDDLIEYFSKNYLGSSDKLDDFFKKVKRVIELFKAIQSPSQQNHFVQKFQSSERTKVVSVLQVARRTIDESKNTNQLLVNIAWNYELIQQQIYPTIIAIWNVCRLVLLKDVFFNDRSQTIRSDFNRLIRTANKESSIYSQLFSKLFEFDEATNNGLFSVSNQLQKDGNKFQLKLNKLLEDPNKAALRTSNNNTAKLLLYYIAHVTDTSSLGNYSEEQYKKEELEHIFPRAYRNNWMDYRYKKEEVINYLKVLHLSGRYRIELNALISEVQLAEDIELVHYASAPHSTPNRLIEWHGNKHILSLKANRSISNKSFQEKKGIIASDRSNLVIPGESTAFGVDNEDWNYKVIIDRSLKILEFFVYDVFNRNWDDVN